VTDYGDTRVLGEGDAQEAVELMVAEIARLRADP
jgi:hypothetical protein